MAASQSRGVEARGDCAAKSLAFSMVSTPAA